MNDVSEHFDIRYTGSCYTLIISPAQHVFVGKCITAHSALLIENVLCKLN